jgi:hypothetical protein
VLSEISEKRRARIEAEKTALRLKPWEFGPSDLKIYEACPYTTPQVRESWARAIELRRQLAATLRARRAERSGRPHAE